MLKITDECVYCNDGKCIGSACPNIGVKRIYCDECKEEIKSEEEVYEVGCDMCPECFEYYIENEWSNLTLEEKADLMGYKHETVQNL